MLVWELFAPNQELSSRLSDCLGVDPLIAQILLNRNIRSLGAAKDYMDGTVPVLLPRDEVEAIWQTMCQNVTENKRFFVFGDYDVDGMTSTTMMMELLMT